MTTRLPLVLAASTALCFLNACSTPAINQELPDFKPIFNGVDFEGWKVDDVAAEVDSQLARLDLRDKILPGQSVAITAGSRGIGQAF